MVNSSQQKYVANDGYNSNPNNPSSMESHGRLHLDQNYEVNNNFQKPPKQGFCASLSSGAKAVLIILIVLAIIAAIVIPIAVVLGKQSNQNSESVTYSLCTQEPAQCEGLSEETQAYLNENFENRDQAMSAVQAVRSLNQISPDASSEELAENFQNVRRALECMSQTMSEQKQEQTYADLQDLALDTDQKTDAYLNMNQEASGTPIQLSSDEQAAANCNFEGSTTSRVRNLQLAFQANQENIEANQVGRAGSSCAVYNYQYGLSPCKVLRHLRQWRVSLASRNIFRFVGIGLRRRPTAPRCLARITREFNFGSITGRARRRWRRGCFDFSNRNRVQVNVEHRSIFINFYRFIKVRTVQYFQLPQYTPDYSITLNYIRLQINLGMKLMMLSHGCSSIHSNAIYQQLSGGHQNSCRQVCVSPGSRNMTNSHYITIMNDAFIIYLKSIGFTPQEPNTPAVTFDDDEDMGDQHELSGYVDKCKQQVVETCATAENETVAGNVTAFDGPITVQLTWNTDVDIDLSIVQPNGGIVNNTSPNGTYGMLAIFDTDSSQEFYYVPEGEVVVGDYIVKVKYVTGDIVTRLRLIIKGQVTYYLKEFDLFSAGNESSIVIIRVTKNPVTGIFVYNFIKSQTPIEQGECNNVTNSINVELTWQTTSVDLDLHIIQPTLFHVYNDNKTGNIGSISADIANGGEDGEIYQTVCKNFSAGQYIVSVNYFSGQGQTIGFIKIVAGNTTFEQNITLIAPVGQAGEQVVPYIVGTIKVEESNGTFIFTFVPWEPECVDSLYVYVAWGDQPDVDLFVKEPTGDIVWYDNKKGKIGNLIYSFANYGPEVYQTTCGSLVAGDYIIRLNYFNGSAPTNATVIVRMGLEWVSYIITLDQAIGSDGIENPPYKVRIIRITKDGDLFVFATAEEIENECPTESLQVTLTWNGAQTDLDLHIIEPSNDYIYNDNAIGTNGNLSADIQTGGGSGETYQTGCNGNASGEYHVAINYFTGQGATIGTITIIIGEQTQTIQVPLIAPVGQAGENIVPYVVGKITVAQINGTLGFTFVPDAPECEDSLKVYVAWGNQTDVDLLVQEPSGDIVSSQNRIGTIGNLTYTFNNYGPEIYQTSCGSLVAGDYAIRLNYLNGSAPTNAIVIVRMGLEWVSYNVELDQVGGEIYKVRIIRITKDGDLFVFATAEEIENECPTESLQVTLTWNGTANLDLHILEPSNTHVYYLQPSGVQGLLSDDIQTGGSQGETYQTKCSVDTSGKYEIGINYFSGQGPTTAIITIMIGNQTNTIQLPVFAPVGPAGNNLVPYKAGVITISFINGTIGYNSVPYTLACEDSFQIYVTWGNQPDVDLYVQEPAGDIVSYSNMNGTVGRLTFDVRNGYGPEAYETTCGSLATGNYTISLNYYQGSAPTNATVIVRMGSEYYSKTILLATADSSLNYVATIIVADNNGTQFSVSD